MAVGDAHVLPSFLTPVLTQLYFRSHRVLLPHAFAEVRGQSMPEKVPLKRVANSQPPGNESDMLITERPRRVCGSEIKGRTYNLKVPGLSYTGSTRVFVSLLGQDFTALD